MCEERDSKRRAFSDMIYLVSPLMTLLSLVSGSSGQNFGTCDYTQTMEPGKEYYAFNANYPQNYVGGSSCRWTAISNRPIKVTCDTFDLPASPKCNQDAVIVQDLTHPIGHRYCGSGTFSAISESNQITIVFVSSPNSRGGKFLCSFETVSDDFEDCRCGWKNPTRVVGGVDTGVNEYPMMAGLVDATDRMLYCGATIVNERQVLTAAHCVKTRNPTDIGVLVGDHDLSTGADTNATKLYRSEKFIIHPKYNDKTQDYDVALVTVRGKIAFSQLVGPVCLPFQHKPDTFAGNYVEVLGWGTVEFAGTISKVLQKARLSVITNNNCQRSYENVRELTTRQLCTYADGKDSCQFDSGGPVLWQNPTTRRVVEVGIISLGGACASGDPAINSRVGAFVEWVEKNTPSGITYCKSE